MLDSKKNIPKKAPHLKKPLFEKNSYFRERAVHLTFSTITGLPWGMHQASQERDVQVVKRNTKADFWVQKSLCEPPLFYLMRPENERFFSSSWLFIKIRTET